LKILIFWKFWNCITPLPIAYIVCTHGIWTPYPWHIDPLPMVYRPPTHCILTPLPMWYRSPYQWYIKPSLMVLWTPLFW
jgi:hypothetical protein